MTPQRSLKLYALFQIAIELYRPTTPTYIKSPQDVYDLLAAELRHLQQEHFICIYLNVKNSVIGQETLAIGSLNATIVHPREIFKLAMRRSSASIICVHNHPSGDPTPSPQDIELTKRLIIAGEIIGIDVLDHVVIGGRKYISMKEQGFV